MVVVVVVLVGVGGGGEVVLLSRPYIRETMHSVLNL